MLRLFLIICFADDKSYSSLTVLNLSLLTQGVTKAMLENAILTNGEIVLSSSSNTDVYDVMLSNLHNIEGVELQ